MYWDWFLLYKNFSSEVSPIVLWLELVILYARYDCRAILEIGREDAAEAVLEVIQAVAGHLRLDGRAKAFEVGNRLPRLKVINENIS